MNIQQIAQEYQSKLDAVKAEYSSNLILQMYLRNQKHKYFEGYQRQEYEEFVAELDKYNVKYSAKETRIWPRTYWNVDIEW